MQKPDIGQIQRHIKEQFGRLKGMRQGKGIKPAGPTAVIGCDYGASKVVLLELEKGLGKPFVKKFELLRRPEKDSSAMIKQAFDSGFSKRTVRVSVKGQSVIVRFVQFPKMSREELSSAIKYEAENYIPFKADEVLMDFHILGDAPGGQNLMDVLLIAVKKDQIYSLIKDFQDAEIQLELIDVDVLASINALSYFFPEDVKTSVAFVDIGSEISTLSIVQGGLPRFIRDISFGGIDIAKRLRRKLAVSREESEKIINQQAAPSEEALQVIKESYEGLCSDLKVSIDYYQSQVQAAQPLEKIFIGGSAGDPAAALSTIEENLRLPVVQFNLDGKVDIAETVNKELFLKSQTLAAVAMGLCLRD